MARPKAKDLPDLRHLAVPGAEIALRVTPGARRNALSDDGGALRAWVTAPAQEGRANDAVRNLLATAMGVAPTRLDLVQGATARDKRFRYSGTSRSL